MAARAAASSRRDVAIDHSGKTFGVERRAVLGRKGEARPSIGRFGVGAGGLTGV
jgi:hypothetical protein